MEILENKKSNKILFIITLIFVFIFCGIGIGNINTLEANTEARSNIDVAYNTHIQGIGWENEFSKQNGEMSGTSGKSLRLEAIKIKLPNEPNISIKYQTHVQGIGWQDWKKNGEISGTSGKSLRLEAIRIQLENTQDYSVMYRVHVQGIGWQDWKYDGEMAGTAGQSLRLEAIEVNIVNKVDRGILNIETFIPTVSYQNDIIHISGWKMANVEDTKIKVDIDDNNVNIIKDENIRYIQRQDVINNVIGYGSIKENANPGFDFQIDTNDLSKGEHIIKIELITKDGKVLQTYTRKIVVDRNPHIKYSAHVQGIGWQEYKQDSEMAGTTGEGLRIESIKIEGINLPQSTKLKYQTHIQGIGWQDWKENGEISGTTGQSLRLEGIRIKLEGNSEYSVLYRTHVQNIGWQNWCYDGETSGTIGVSKRIESIEIKIVPKITENRIFITIDNPWNQISNTNGRINGWVMTNIEDVGLKMYIDDIELLSDQIKRYTRQDVLNTIKGYGDENIYNINPGFEIPIDFSEYSLGEHKLTVRAISKGVEVGKVERNFTIKKQITYEVGTYGVTGLSKAGDSRGTELKYYKYGSGPNVFYATFAIHGFEDIWDKDGNELVEIANNFYHKLINSNDYDLAEKWTIYIFPGVNQDGLNYGYTNNGPGRTTLFSEVPSRKGIDMNRCWQVGNTYKRYTDSRNYNGTEGFQAYEARYLRNFLINHKSENGKTVLVDLHGWTQQLIGDSGICSYYRQQFPENDGSAIGRYGTGYLINWARSTLGARSALIELPNEGVNGHQSVINKNFSNRYIEATLNMLRNI